MAIGAWDKTADAAGKAIDMGSKIVTAVGDVGKVLGESHLPLSVPPFESVEQGMRRLQQGQQPGQQGGAKESSNLNALPYTLLGTIVLIALSGFVATYYRSKKHVTVSQDDRPPEPGVFRVPDQKGTNP
jgi:hypothetical protein